jgi:hypothetical protein
LDAREQLLDPTRTTQEAATLINQQMAALAAERPTELPCINGCARRGTEDNEEPELLGARHGRYCDRCFFQTQSALRIAPALAGHIATLVGTKSRGDSEIRTEKDAPLPFNAQAFDDLNGIYEELVKFAGLFAVRLRIEKPEVALNAWRTPTGRVKGLAAGVSAWSAKRETAFIVTWLDQHLEKIFSSIISDDPHLDILDYFMGEMKHFRSLAARWPSKMQAQYSRLPHSDGVTCCWPRRIAIFPAEAEGESRQIRCDGCGHIWTEDEYAAEVIAYEQAERAHRRPNRVQKHLISKYLDGAA